MSGIAARVDAEQADHGERQRRVEPRLAQSCSAREGQGRAGEHEGHGKERDESPGLRGHPTAEGDGLDPGVVPGREPDHIVERRREGSPCGEVDDHRRRNEGFAGDRARQPGAVPGEGEKHRDDGDAQERAPRLGDHGGGAGEQSGGEGSPPARRAVECQEQARGRGHRGSRGEPVVVDAGPVALREDGPADREQRGEGTGSGRETGRGVDEGGDRRDDAHGKRPHRGEADAEELHPARDDQEASGRKELEEVAIQRLSAEDPRGPVEYDAFIAEPLDVAEERGADERRAQRDCVEQRIAEERWAPGQHPA